MEAIALESDRSDTGPEPSPTTAEPDGATLRIVVYGAPGVGKTSTARALAKGLGQEVLTPEEHDDGTTVWFDWFEYVGGSFDGRPIRTQFLTVPGHLPERRRSLLRDADAVLFVVDSSPAGVTEAEAFLADLREGLADLTEPRPHVVVAANKRDHPDAVSLDAIRDQLGLDEATALIETVATSGDGVRHAFVFTVRVGLQRLRDAGDLRGDALPGAEDLLAELRAASSSDGPVDTGENASGDDTDTDAEAEADDAADPGGTDEPDEPDVEAIDAGPVRIGPDDRISAPRFDPPGGRDDAPVPLPEPLLPAAASSTIPPGDDTWHLAPRPYLDWDGPIDPPMLAGEHHLASLDADVFPSTSTVGPLDADEIDDPWTTAPPPDAVSPPDLVPPPDAPVPPDVPTVPIASAEEGGPPKRKRRWFRRRPREDADGQP